jgi:hypothetical protein
MRITGLFALVLGVATLGCGDDIKFPDPPELPDPALNGVNPPSGFKSRTIEVQVSGDATEFTSEATVTFGAGITVDSVTVASPSLLIATITIAGDAALGARDVIVTDGANTTSLLQAFEVRNPIDVFVAGPAQQGGFVQVLLINRDTDNPWLGDVVVTAGTGVNFNVPLLADPPTIVNPFQIVGTAFFDVDAVTGPVTVEDTLLDTVTTTGADLVVTPRTPIALQPVTSKGQPAGQTATVTLNDSTALLSFQTSGLVLADVFVPGKGEGGFPAMIFLQGGKWSDIRTLNSSTIDEFGGVDPVPVVGTGFVVVLDVFEFIFGTDDPPYDFQLDVDDQFFPLPNVTQIAEVEPNNAPGATATNVGAVHLVTGVIDADLDNNNDLDDDVFKVTLTTGQGIRVQTTTGKTLVTDTVISILVESTVTPGTFVEVDSSGDFFNGEGITTGPLPAGDYFVVVGDGFAGFTGDDYELAIDLIEAPVN